MWQYGPDNFPANAQPFSFGTSGLGEPFTPQQVSASQLRADVDGLMRDAKIGGTIVIVLQAIAALAALGIFLVQVKAMMKRK